MHPCLGAVSIHYSPAPFPTYSGFVQRSVTELRGASTRIDIVQNVVHMAAMLTETFSNARNNLKAVLDRVIADHAPIKITRQRGEAVVVVSERDWESMEETLYLLSSPRNAAILAEAIAELDAGNGQVRELIEP